MISEYAAWLGQRNDKFREKDAETAAEASE